MSIRETEDSEVVCVGAVFCAEGVVKAVGDQEVGVVGLHCGVNFSLGGCWNGGEGRVVNSPYVMVETIRGQFDAWYTIFTSKYILSICSRKFIEQTWKEN